MGGVACGGNNVYIISMIEVGKESVIVGVIGTGVVVVVTSGRDECTQYSTIGWGLSTCSAHKNGQHGFKQINNNGKMFI